MCLGLAAQAGMSRAYGPESEPQAIEIKSGGGTGALRLLVFEELEAVF